MTEAVAADLAAFSARLQYNFQDPDLLALALTHRSRAAETRGRRLE